MERLSSFIKICEQNSTLILVVTCGYLEYYLRVFIHNVNPEFASAKLSVLGLKAFFSALHEVSTRMVARCLIVRPNYTAPPPLYDPVCMKFRQE